MKNSTSQVINNNMADQLPESVYLGFLVAQMLWAKY